MSIRRSIYYRMSPAWRRRSRRIAFAPLDAWTAVRGGRSYNGIPLPRRGEIFTGGGDFLETGLRFLEHFKRLGSLAPGHDVLEIGSGQGRMAIPLTGYLDADGSYVGFDVVESAVSDCRRRISSRFPAFRFVHLPVANDLYTDDGAPAAEASFPVDTDTIDLAFATSVFSHMEPDGIGHYLREARRAVRPGGRLLATFFLMDPAAEAASRDSDFRFPFRDGDAWFMSRHPRSANVALAPDTLTAMAEAAGWTSVTSHHGSWSGRPGPTLDYQDLVVLT